jgi:uncharacterized protein YwqG
MVAQAAHFAEHAHYPPRDIAEASAGARWRLQLQLDSDDACMWGTDSGMVYFLIHDDDLARWDFSRVVSVCVGLCVSMAGAACDRLRCGL